MSWLSQNWIWLVFAIGVLFLVTRRGGAGCGHSSHQEHAHDVAGGGTAEAGTVNPDPQAQQRTDRHRHHGC